MPSTDTINMVQAMEMSDVLKMVISSWQVIAVTVALVLYLFIVFYVAKAYRRPRMSPIKIKLRRSKSAETAGGPEEAGSGGDSNEDLGLEEE